MARRDLLLVQMDEAYERLRRRLEALTEDEYFWEPVPGCWTVHRDETGRRVAGVADLLGHDRPRLASRRRDRLPSGSLSGVCGRGHAGDPPRDPSGSATESLRTSTRASSRPQSPVGSIVSCL